MFPTKKACHISLAIIKIKMINIRLYCSSSNAPLSIEKNSHFMGVLAYFPFRKHIFLPKNKCWAIKYCFFCGMEKRN